MPVLLPRDIVTAGSGSEFRALLTRVREHAGLSGGQVAQISGINRRVVYHLGYARVSNLPPNREQVEDYLKACRLADESLSLVMELWAALRQVGAGS